MKNEKIKNTQIYPPVKSQVSSRPAASGRTNRESTLCDVEHVIICGDVTGRGCSSYWLMGCLVEATGAPAQDSYGFMV